MRFLFLQVMCPCYFRRKQWGKFQLNVVWQIAIIMLSFSSLIVNNKISENYLCNTLSLLSTATLKLKKRTYEYSIHA